MSSKMLILHGASKSTVRLCAGLDAWLSSEGAQSAQGAVCTSRVLATIGELGLVEGKDYEFDNITDVKDFPRIYAPEWIANQPFGQMPYLEDPEEGLVIYESRAISRLQIPLVISPSDGMARYAAFEQAVFSESQQIDAAALTVLKELFFGPRHGTAPNQTNADAHTALLAKKLAVYDTILGKRQFVAGETMTVADLWHMPDLVLAHQIGKAPTLLDGTLPNVIRWFKAVQESRGWQFAPEQGFGKF